MSSEENTKTVEEIEEVVEEAEEVTVVEESQAEEPQIEEPIEETTEEAQPEKKSKNLLGWLIAAGVVLVLAIGYFATSLFFSDKFLMRTSVNGIDCTGKTMQEVETLIQKQVEGYVLNIETIQLGTETIKGTDIDIRYKGYKQIQEAFDEQNSYLWPKAIFIANDIKAEIIFEYNKEKLDAAIMALECLKAENQIAPIAATIVYKENAFVIQEETYGTQLKTEQVKELIYDSIDAMDTSINLDKSNCYVQPKYTSTSTEVTTARDTMNSYLNAEVTYSLDGVDVVVNKETFSSWISVDENMQPVISQELAKQYATTLANTYNTPDRPGVLTTPTGKQVQMQNAILGRQIGVDAESTQLISNIQAGKKVKRAPAIARQAMADGQFVWGTTYVEVDITEQHMWYFQNGTLVFETDVVTGLKGSNDTPTGIFSLLEKKQNTTLVGRIVNGEPLYRTPVSYWMRVTWSGIGFHDASWQPTFGGTRYLTNGSHGCINMPPAKAGQFYNMIQLGTSVVIHY